MLHRSQMHLVSLIWICIVVLAAGCGGGGGGGDGGGTTQQQSSSPTSSPTLAQPAPNTASTYEATYASFNYAPPKIGETMNANVTIGAPQPQSTASRVVLTTGNSSEYSSLQLAMPQFNRVWQANEFKVLPVDPATLQPDAFLEDAGVTPGAEFIAWGPEASLAYASYGIWLKDSPAPTTSGIGGFFAFGQPTPSSGIPASGVSVFTGTIRGFFFDAFVTGNFAQFEANVVISANFATRQLTLATNGTTIFLPNGFTVGRADLNCLGSATWDSSGQLTGNMSAPGVGAGSYMGSLRGALYGPRAQETAVVFSLTRHGTVSNDSAYLVGGWAAKGS